METPKAYSGKIRIECGAPVCPQGIRQNVRATCADCPHAAVLIVDLEDRVLHESDGAAWDNLGYETDEARGPEPLNFDQ